MQGAIILRGLQAFGQPQHDHGKKRQVCRPGQGAQAHGPGLRAGEQDVAGGRAAHQGLTVPLQRAAIRTVEYRALFPFRNEEVSPTRHAIHVGLAVAPGRPLRLAGPGRQLPGPGAWS
jgi:hypothetical protein